MLKGKGYEFCNCDFGCGCNFGGVPNSKDGSCQAFVGSDITQGRRGDVDLSGVKCAAVITWPTAIHHGGGKGVLCFDSGATDAQVAALVEIFTGKAGGLLWELLGPTYDLVGVVKTAIRFSGNGPKSRMTVDGVGEAIGDTLKNPVTGEDHFANVELPGGFIWTHGQCGQGTFRASAEGLSLAFEKTNWIHYDFEWSNAESMAAV